MNTANSADPLFDPFSPEFAQNPYPTYKRLREEDPVHWSPLGFWMVTRFEDVDFVLRDKGFGQDPVVMLNSTGGESAISVRAPIIQRLPIILLNLRWL